MKLSELLEKAAPRPWRWESQHPGTEFEHLIGMLISDSHPTRDDKISVFASMLGKEDAALIAHTANTYEELVAALERLLKMTNGVLTEEQLDFNHGTKQEPDTLRRRFGSVQDALEKAQNVEETL